MGVFADRVNLISKLNFRKSINVFRLVSSYYLSRIFKKARHRGMPLAVSVEPTTACFLVFSRNTGNLKSDSFDRLVTQLEKELIYLTFYFQGEPFINPDFLGMVKTASSRGIYTSTSTNAHFLNEETAIKTIQSGLDRLIISIDGTTQEIYEMYRKEGNLQKAIEGTRQVVAQKKRLNSQTPHIIIQFLVVRHNEHQINDVFDLANELGVDEVRLKTAQVYDYEKGNDLFPKNEKS